MGFCDILFSSSLALAAPAPNAAITPRQLANSILRIANLPCCFEFIYLCGWLRCAQGQHLRRNAFPKPLRFWSLRPPTSMRHRQIQRTEVQLKPETIKCYSRQLERAIEIIFACHAPCVLRRKLCNARSRGCGFAAGRRPNE